MSGEDGAQDQGVEVAKVLDLLLEKQGQFTCRHQREGEILEWDDAAVCIETSTNTYWGADLWDCLCLISHDLGVPLEK